MSSIQSLPYDLEKASSLSFFYTPSFIDYFPPIYKGVNKSCTLHAGNTKLLCPVVVSERGVRIGGISYMSAPYLYGEESKKNTRKLVEQYIEYTEELGDNISFRVDPTVPFDSKLMLAFLELGFDIKTLFTTIIHLDQDKALIWQNLRDRYKSSINKFFKTNEVVVVTGENHQEKIQDWKDLYFMLTGRANASPPEESFKISSNSIKEGKAVLFLVYREGRLAAGIHVPFTQHAAYYFAGGTHPDFEGSEPFTHALMWKAIEYMKESGVKFFEIGPIMFTGMKDFSPSQKELDIVSFKLGMGGVLTPFLLFSKNKKDQTESDSV